MLTPATMTKSNNKTQRAVMFLERYKGICTYVHMYIYIYTNIFIQNNMTKCIENKGCP